MQTDIIACKVVQCDLSIAGARATEMSDSFQQSDCEHLFEIQIKGDIDMIQMQLLMQYEKKWVDEII
jgi:hypothetical protein